MKNRRFFTLFEIMICLAILSLVGGLVSWQAKEMVETHQFHKSIDHLLSDLRRMQIISLSDRADIELHIEKTEKGYQYWVRSDEPLLCFSSNKVKKLAGVKKMTIGGKPVKNPLVVTLFFNGQITPKEKVTLHQKEETKEGYLLNLETPLCIDLSKIREA